MRRFAVAAGSFALTFALLSVAWMVSFGRASSDTPEPTPSHTPYYTLAATPRPPTTPPQPTTQSPSATPNATPSSAPTQGEGATPTPVPLRTPAPSFALPSGAAGSTQVLVVKGSEFVSSQVPDGGSLTPYGDGVVLQTTQAASDVLWVTYKPDLTQLPAGAQVVKVDTRICGEGGGQFWEVYGPVGSSPMEYEVTPADADGCWHFTDAPFEDLSVIASTMLESSLVVDKVEYTVTFAQ